MSVLDELTDERIAAATLACEGVATRTPVLPSPVLTELVGRQVVLKAENLQVTGSFKLRGALAKMAALGDAAAAGVVAGSAGNHGRAVAYAARLVGVPCHVYVPAEASITKTEACVGLGAIVHREAPSVDAAVAAAQEDAERTGRCFFHPFDDLDVIAGQATVGVELLDEVADLGLVLVPIGGGGLAAGVAAALAHRRRGVRVVGVQSAACASLLASRAAGQPVTVEGAPTIADGIAVKTPGERTFPMVQRLVDDIVAVEDADIAEAVIDLFESSKLVVEGAGAVGVAALRGGLVDVGSGGTVAVVLSGGNIDPGTLGDAIRTHETRAGRRLALFARLDDRPGTLASLLAGVAELGANVIDIEHVREGIELRYGQTGVHLVVQVRDRAHAERVLAWAAGAGFDVATLRAVSTRDAAG